MQRLRDFLRKNNHLYAEVLCLLAFNAFAFAVLWGPFLAGHSLLRDTLKLYSFFRDNLHALNFYGEVQWWNPHVQWGFPVYYPSLLGFDRGTILFAIASLASWTLGLLHVRFTSFYALYVLYSGLLLPCLFSLALLFLARPIFKDFRVILFILLAASFSPGTVENLSNNVGLEQSAYSLFFAAAFLHYLKKPNKKTFLGLLLTSLILSAGFNWPFLFWNVLFLPLFVGVVCLCDTASPFARLQASVRAVPLWYRAAGILACGVCALPNILVFSQGSDILRASIGQRVHAFHSLISGFPMEIIVSGTPGVGSHCVTPFSEAGIFPFGRVLHVAYCYMGMLALPLSAVGLTVGPRLWRKRLFVLLTVAGAIIPLASFSPLFASLLVWPTPLRAVNHYGEAVFRNGTFFLLILSAALGAQTVLRCGRKSRWLLAAFFAGTSIISLALFLGLYGSSSLSNPIFGFSLVMTVLYLVMLAQWALCKRPAEKSLIFRFLLVLTFVDISTVAFWDVRNDLLPATTKVEEPSPSSIGMGHAAGSTYANTFLELRAVKRLKEAHFPISSLPELALYEKNPAGGLLGHAEEDMPKTIPGSIQTVQQSYNAIALEVTSTRDALLFWRDAYSPYWKATVNGKETQLVEAFGAFKSAPVPAGKSKVIFRFSPGFVPYAFLFSYMPILATFWAWIKAPTPARAWPSERKTACLPRATPGP